MPQDDSTTGAVSGGGATSTVRADGAQLRPGQRIGHYKILEQIGEGGLTVLEGLLCQGCDAVFRWRTT